MGRAALLSLTLVGAACRPGAPAPGASSAVASAASSASVAPPASVAAAPPKPVTVGELQMFVPAVLFGLERKNVNVLASAGVVSGRYEGAGRRADLVLHVPADLGSAKAFYEAQYPTRGKAAGEVVYARLHQPVAPSAAGEGPKVAEACVMLRARINVCVSVTPGREAGDAVSVLEAVDLGPLAKRAEAR